MLVLAVIGRLTPDHKVPVQEQLLSGGAVCFALLQAAQGLTFAPPMVPRAAEVNDTMVGALERVLSGRVPAAQALPEAARRVRQITAEP